MEKFLKYFAYGSNMDLEFLTNMGVKWRNPKRGILDDFMFFPNVIDSWDNDLGYSNIIPKDGKVVEGVLMEVSEDSIPLLDQYEGFPELYSKIYLPINSGNDIENVMVYIGNGPFCSSTARKLSTTQKQRVKNGFTFLSNSYTKSIGQYVL